MRRLLLSGAAWAALVVAAVGFTVRLLPVNSHLVLALAAFAPYLGLFAVIAVAGFLAGRRWWAAVLAAVLAGASMWVQIPLFTPAGPGAADSVALRVLTANLREGRADPTMLARIARDNADLLVVQELTPELAARLDDSELAAEFPHRVLDPRTFANGGGMWSRYPITRTAPVLGYQMATLTARIAVPGTSGDITVLATHLVGPWPEPITGWRDEIAAMATTLADLAGTAGRQPVIVAGDFNAAVDMRPFRELLATGYHDAAEQSGAGLTRTFPADTTLPPLVGIDHILTRNADATGARAVRIPGSDHLGLIATVHLAPG